MRILVVVSGNHAQVASFVTEQVEALRQAGCKVELFLVTGHGFLGYLQNLKFLTVAIHRFNPDIIHAHYGLCGLLCTLQHKVPVVVTYHGSDINNRQILPFSRLAIHRAAHNIFVAKKLQKKCLDVLVPRGLETFSSVIPCGVDLNIFHPIQRDIAYQTLGLDPETHYILFAGAFDNEVKNPQLAKEAIELFNSQSEQKEGIHLLELKGYCRYDVALLMNAVDCLLMTSHSEGSPQVIKEALVCGCPIVSVDVGDVAEQLEIVEGCYVATNNNPKVLAELLKKAMAYDRTNAGKQKNADCLDNRHVAKELLRVYRSVIK